MTDRIFSLAALTVLELSPPEMVEVAARAGYSQVGLRLLPATPEERHFPLLTDAALRRQTLERLRDTGIQVSDVEILRLRPETRPADFLPVLECAAEFGARHLLVAGNDDDEARLTANFAELCDLAAPFALNPHLEFMPWTGVPTLTQAARIVEASGRDNACVLVDAFHFDRSGGSHADLAKIAPQRMGYIQLCDVPGPRPAEMAEIIRQARSERRFPGDGDADLPRLLAALPQDIPLSLEVPTERLREQGVSALERARLALDKARAVLAQLPQA